jgi:prefoldin beta subunit
VLIAVQTEGYTLSDELSKLPPQVQERLLRLQQLQQTLQSVLTQKQQVDMENTEVDHTLAELQKTADDVVIYKSAGSLLVKAEKAKVTEELVERKELLNTRVKVLSRQEERLRSQAKDVQTKLQEDLRPISPASK